MGHLTLFSFFVRAIAKRIGLLGPACDPLSAGRDHGNVDTIESNLSGGDGGFCSQNRARSARAAVWQPIVSTSGLSHRSQPLRRERPMVLCVKSATTRELGSGIGGGLA